ncbi:type 2 isopentenyl-diphosphate Delta-isomerase [Candidatus Bathyarchaeota archaeon]|nr:type 2 isopentenyl-diphosphate Delta-isomerase [Candidatus Bathyarchaeota archaeon]
MAEKTRKRKADHIRIATAYDVQAKNIKTGFEDIHFIHKALPEIDKDEIDLSVNAFSHAFKAPIIVDAMTGGTPKAEKINAIIATAVEKLGLGMGVGSQRAALEDKKLVRTFAIVRKKAPTAFIIANIGAVQLVRGYSISEVKKAIEMIEADAIAIHLNSLQEAIQPEGETSFKGILGKIKEITLQLDKPVIVKETGAGIASEEAKKLEAVGVKGINVSGAGGTSFAAVEYYRAKEIANNAQSKLGETFWDWGIPTAVSLIEVIQSVRVPVIASGGLRNGLDIAKALSLGASLAGFAHPILTAALNGGEENVEKTLTLIIEELRNTMFLVGAKDCHALRHVPVVITGKTAEWLRIRGFRIDEYARRGR